MIIFHIMNDPITPCRRVTFLQIMQTTAQRKTFFSSTFKVATYLADIHACITAQRLRRH